MMSIAHEKSEIQCLDEKPESVGAEKAIQIVQIDNVQVLGLDPDDADFYINYPEEKRKKVIHKVSGCLPILKYISILTSS